MLSRASPARSRARAGTLPGAGASPSHPPFRRLRCAACVECGPARPSRGARPPPRAATAEGRDRGQELGDEPGQGFDARAVPRRGFRGPRRARPRGADLRRPTSRWRSRPSPPEARRPELRWTASSSSSAGWRSPTASPSSTTPSTSARASGRRSTSRARATTRPCPTTRTTSQRPRVRHAADGGRGPGHRPAHDAPHATRRSIRDVILFPLLRPKGQGRWTEALLARRYLLASRRDAQVGVVAAAALRRTRPRRGGARPLARPPLGLSRPTSARGSPRRRPTSSSRPRAGPTSRRAEGVAARLAALPGVVSVTPVVRGRGWITARGQAIPAILAGREGTDGIRARPGASATANDPPGGGRHDRLLANEALAARPGPGDSFAPGDGGRDPRHGAKAAGGGSCPRSPGDSRPFGGRRHGVRAAPVGPGGRGGSRLRGQELLLGRRRPRQRRGGKPTARCFSR